MPSTRRLGVDARPDVTPGNLPVLFHLAANVLAVIIHQDIARLWRMSQKPTTLVVLVVLVIYRLAPVSLVRHDLDRQVVEQQLERVRTGTPVARRSSKRATAHAHGHATPRGVLEP